jgi:7,8-dihydropterin-6-yl-methyl-4-(beta-D-ribofuranosyl)aminobenzene 5'-phosphate synthase
MRILTLVENTSVSPEYGCKHGLSFYIETARHKILFDLGSDDLFLTNAQKLGVCAQDVDTVIISHAHNDHGGALALFLAANQAAKIYIQRNAFLPTYTKVLGLQRFVGLDASLSQNQRIVFVDDLLAIDDDLLLFANVTQRECFSRSNRALFIKTPEGFVQDEFLHEQNLIIHENGQSILVAGCAHNGIVNILGKAESLVGGQLDYVLAGFHLFNPITRRQESQKLVREIADRLKTRRTLYYTGHCTGRRAYYQLKERLGDQIGYLAAGSSLEIGTSVGREASKQS